MKLTDTQKELLGSKLTGLHTKCSSCGHTGFTILDKIFEMREFNAGDLVVGGENSSILPAIVLVCNNCAEIRLLSALALGVLDNTEKKVNKDG